MGQSDNILEHDRPRVGWLSWADMPVGGELAATLIVDDSGQIWLRVPFMQQIPPSRVERWFEGTATRFGDDPNRTLYTYEVPDEMAFVDHDGPVILVGCQSRGFNSTLGGAGVGRISVTAAVIGGRVFGYSYAHGLRTEIPGLRNWFGISSVTIEDERDSRGLFREVRMKVRASNDIPPTTSTCVLTPTGASNQAVMSWRCQIGCSWRPIRMRLCPSLIT